MRALAFLALVPLACGHDAGLDSDQGGKADGDQRAADIVAMQLQVDLARKQAIAVIDLRPDQHRHATLEVKGLDVVTVSTRHDLEHGRLELYDLPSPARVTIRYRFAVQDSSDGLLASGVTLLWPYHCGNLFPCHSDPADGFRFQVDLHNVPDGATAIVPPTLPTDGPAYMLAWAVGDYQRADLGTTRAGTRVGVYFLPGGRDTALAGTRHLTAAFDWLEQHIGPYAFGDEVASVAARWGAGAYGGMEHHPYWHVAEGAMGDAETHAHEAAHGWFGDGVRIQCWEDFVLSEGTVSYLAARAMGQVAGADVEAAIWADYHDRLERAIARGDRPVWPEGCNQIDILADGLFSDLPYMKGAFFYRAVAEEIGAEKLDEVLATFYQERRGTAAGMQDMLDAIQAQTGFDPSALASHWLR